MLVSVGIAKALKALVGIVRHSNEQKKIDGKNEVNTHLDFFLQISHKFVCNV